MASKPMILNQQAIIFYDKESYGAFWEAVGKPPQLLDCYGKQGFFYQGFYCYAQG